MKDKGRKKEKMTTIIDLIIFEDDHLLAIAKPFGMLTQSDRTGDLAILDLAQDYVAEKGRAGDDYLGLVHRLDRPVGGVILLARTLQATKCLSEMFKERKVKKMYLARVEGEMEPPSGELNHALLKSGKKVRVVKKGMTGAKEARLFYRTLDLVDGKNESLVEVELVTGRRHQIRAQLSEMGNPIIGDIKYGSTKRFINGGIALFSRSLTFLHPATGVEVTISAEPPEELF